MVEAMTGEADAMLPVRDLAGEHVRAQIRQQVETAIWRYVVHQVQCRVYPRLATRSDVKDALWFQLDAAARAFHGHSVNR